MQGVDKLLHIMINICQLWSLLPWAQFKRQHSLGYLLSHAPCKVLETPLAGIGVNVQFPNLDYFPAFVLRLDVVIPFSKGSLLLKDKLQQVAFGENYVFKIVDIDKSPPIISLDLLASL